MAYFATKAALTAALCMAATPAFALDAPRSQTSHLAQIDYEMRDIGAQSANGWDRYDRYDRRSRRRHRRNRIGAGDVIAGVLVLGALAAIVGSSSDKDDDRERYRDRRDDRNRDRDVNYNRESQQSRGIDRAVDMCVEQVARGNREVAQIDNAARNAQGWTVNGKIEGGLPFNCQIDNDGRIRSVNYAQNGGISDASSSQGNSSSGNSYYVPATEVAQAGQAQHSDAVYRQARENLRNGGAAEGYSQSNEQYGRDFSQDGVQAGQSGQSQQLRERLPAQYRETPADIDGDLRPAYPGGPLPGEEGYAESIGG